MGVAKGKTGLKTDTRKSTTATLKINHIAPRAMAVATALCSIRDPKMHCQLKTLKHKEGGVVVIIPKNHHITITIIINIMTIVITKMNAKI